MEHDMESGNAERHLHAPFRGVFAIPPTPFGDDGGVDEVSLQRCVDFCIQAGVGGIVIGVNASEAIALTDEERIRVAAIVVDRTAGRVPVVVGVSGVSIASSALYAREAARAGADSVMAMPPYVRNPSLGELPEFYAAVAAAADGLPVWIQDCVAPGMPIPVSLMVSMLQDIEGVSYVKEETIHGPQVISAILSEAGEACKGVMGGMAGRYMVEEARRGACGTMPACEVADAHGKVWAALERGDEPEARRLHQILLPLLDYEAMYSFLIYKEVLYRRGVIANPRTRVPNAGSLDRHNHRELDLLLDDLVSQMGLDLIYQPAVD